MIKVKTFVMRDCNCLHLDKLDKQINFFISENRIEVVDIKYSTAMSGDNGITYWKASALLIYKEEDDN